MHRSVTVALAAAALVSANLAAHAQASQPPFATTKVEGTENVYIFRYQNHQSMFVVTPEGVIATDPIGLARPQAVTTYIDEIKKITNAPIRYVIYSHHHYDHVAGGQPFKALGATFIAHRRAKERLETLKTEHVVMPDEVVDNQRTVTLGGTTLELSYVGRNHSDSSLVMRLPRERLIFAVDFIPIQAISTPGIIDSYPGEWEASLQKVLAMDWDRLVPGHPYGGRLGTKRDVEDLLGYFQALSAEVKKAADAGKCWDAAEKEVRLPQFASWLGYEQGIAANVRRFCGY